MAKSRKTIEVADLVKYANEHLARKDEYADIKFKCGVTVMIETILLRSDNYRGFMFLDNNDTEIGTLGYFSRKYSI